MLAVVLVPYLEFVLFQLPHESRLGMLQFRGCLYADFFIGEFILLKQDHSRRVAGKRP